MVEREADHWRECICLTRLTMIELERAQPEEALRQGERLTVVAEKMGEGSEGPVAAALGALARRARGAAGGAEEAESRVDLLRQIDNKAFLAYALNFLAEIDLDEGRPAAARGKAEQALAAAEAVGRLSEIAVSRALLARACRSSGDPEGARRHLARGVGEDPTSPDLSARARKALAIASREAGAEIQTGASTGASTHPA
jgi:tetratricopeptide (TPR) repeat protein